MKIAVLDADTLGRDLDLSPLSDVGNVTVYPMSYGDEVSKNLGDSEVALVNKLKINESTVGENKNLKLVCVFATGYDNIDLDFCRKRGIAVTNVVGYSTMSVAQLTISMALYLYGRLPIYRDFVSSGKYTQSGIANLLDPPYCELAGKTWGIAGYGDIGSAVGKVAEALGCNIIAFKRKPIDGVKLVDIDTLCRNSDILSVHLPLNNETRGIFTRERIGLLKNGAVFINVARGAVTDEKALADALKEGRLGGLGCDVYSEEPFPKEHPYTEIMNRQDVCFTPHMAWGALEARERCLHEICENIKAFENGIKRSRVD